MSCFKNGTMKKPSVANPLWDLVGKCRNDGTGNDIRLKLELCPQQFVEPVRHRNFIIINKSEEVCLGGANDCAIPGAGYSAEWLADVMNWPGEASDLADGPGALGG